VNFDKDMVLAIFLGSRPTPNHSVTVERVREEATRITVEATERRPRSNCILPSISTTPFTVVLVPTRAQDVTFEIAVKAARQCGHK